MVGVLVYFQPDLILSVVDAEHRRADGADVLDDRRVDRPHAHGRRRLDDVRLLHPQQRRHRVPVLRERALPPAWAASSSSPYNGAMFGAVAGYLTERGLGETFFSFVVTHGGVRADGHRAVRRRGLEARPFAAERRAGGRAARASCRRRARCVVICLRRHGDADRRAPVEAFWSSSLWVPREVKYGVAAVCWLAVLAYLALQGRRAT